MLHSVITAFFYSQSTSLLLIGRFVMSKMPLRSCFFCFVPIEGVFKVGDGGVEA